jgi:putative tryptophan/tyrosine transport system substrate-binding protein
VQRRDFIALLLGVATARAPAFPASAQQPDRMRLIGVLTGFDESDPEGQRPLSAFHDGLNQLGWVDGHNIRTKYRWGARDASSVRTEAAELVRLAPDVVLVNSSSVLRPLLQETRTIPIVFLQVNDPVASGFVASLAHPGGNITGFTPAETSMGGKWIQLLKQVAPAVNVIAAILSLSSTANVAMLRAAEAIASSIDVRMTTLAVSNGAEIERAVEEFARQPNGGLIVLPDPVTNFNRELIISLAARYKLPAVYAYRYFVADGGLLSYGIDPADQYRQAAAYVHRILKGEKPADMPVQQPTKFELVINLKTAKAIGLTIPESILLGADWVIE